MPWLYFALSAGCFAIAFKTHSLGIAALFLLFALGLLLAGALSLVSARIQSRSQSVAAVLGPEQAAVIRRRAAAAATPPLGAVDRSDAADVAGGNDDRSD